MESGSSALRLTALRLTTVLLIGTSLLALTPVPTSAQQGDSNEMARYRLADSYMRTGSYERAIPILENLYRENRDSPMYYQKLKEAYASLKQYGQALELVQGKIDREGPSPGRLSEKASLLAQQGREDAAVETWNAAIELAPQSGQTYRSVYRSMIQQRRYEQAIEVLRRGRQAVDQPSAFAMDLAYLYSLNGRHAEAADEYLNVLAQSPDRLSLVKQRLSRFGDEEGALLDALRSVRTRVQQRPLYRPFRELAGWLYLQTGRYSQAFQTFQAIDRLEQEEGRVVYEFAEKAASAGAFAASQRAYRHILDRYPEGPVAPDATLGLADLNRRRARSDSLRASPDSSRSYLGRARSAYQQFVEQHPRHPRHPYALFQLGKLELEVYDRPEQAKRRFRQIIRQYPDTPEAHQALLERGRVYLREGDISAARQAFTHVEDTVQSGPVGTQAQFELALLEFYEGHFRSARTRARLLGNDASEDVANDAIELQVLISENQGPDSLDRPLRTFARARLDARQNDASRAVGRLDSLLEQYPDHGLVDEALFLKGDLLDRSGRADSAASAYLRLVELRPESPLADRSLFQAAELYTNPLRRPQRGIELLTRLLNEYPGSPFQQAARDRIRRLRREA